jgi:hypothetical protein
MAEAEAPKSLTDADDPSAILKGDGPPPGGDPPPSSPPAENKESPTDSPSKKGIVTCRWTDRALVLCVTIRKHQIFCLFW